jgi:hypothetical protein
MKHSASLLAGMLLVAAMVPAAAQEASEGGAYYEPGTYPRLNVKRTVLNYQRCLESPIHGIMESSLGHIIWLRLVRPDADLTPLKEEIMRLAAEGPTCCIRYRARLAATVFDSPGVFASVAKVPYNSENELFAQVAARAENLLFTDNR